MKPPAHACPLSFPILGAEPKCESQVKSGCGSKAGEAREERNTPAFTPRCLLPDTVTATGQSKRAPQLTPNSQAGVLEDT